MQERICHECYDAVVQLPPTSNKQWASLESVQQLGDDCRMLLARHASAIQSTATGSGGLNAIRHDYDNTLMKLGTLTDAAMIR